MAEEPLSKDEVKAMAGDAAKAVGTQAAGAAGWLKRRGCLFWGVAAVVVLWVLGSQAGEEKRVEREAAAAGKPDFDSPRQIDVTARELNAAFKANEVAAKARFDGARVRVTGTIEAIDLDLTDEPVVRLETGQMFEWVSLHLGAEGKAAAAGLAKGQKIAALCDRVGEVIGSAQLSDCTLVK